MFKIASILIPAYILLLPFQRLGLPVHRYFFAPADIVFVLGFLLFLPRLVKSVAARQEVLRKDFLRFGVFYGIFFAAVLFSLLVSKHPMAGLVDLLPFVYAAGMIVLFGMVFTGENPGLEKWLQHSLALALGMISLATFVPASIFPGWSRLIFEGTAFPKYVFFTNNPNQLSVLVLVYFGIFLLLRSEGRVRSRLYDILLPVLFMNAVLWSGSRIAFMSGLVLLSIFGWVLFREIFDRAPGGRWAKTAVFGCSLALVLLVSYYHLGATRNWTAYRSVSGVQAIAVKLFPPGRGSRAEKFSPHEAVVTAFGVRREINSLAVKCFFEHPVTGVGLGQFKGNYHHYEVHNSVLGIAAETGILGLFGLSLWLGYLFFAGFRWAFAFRGRLVVLAGVLIAVLVPHWFHYLLRERWVWFFFCFLLYLSGSSTGKTAGKVPAGPGMGTAVPAGK